MIYPDAEPNEGPAAGEIPVAEKIYWEDVAVGQMVELGQKRVEADEIIAFAREFDPQPFHTDAEAAKSTLVGELTASGWHSCCMMMRLMFDGFLSKSSSLGSGGLDEVNWLGPVRPGDVISGRYTVLESRASKSRPNLGICKCLCEVWNQHGELVMTCRFTQFMGRRPGMVSP